MADALMVLKPKARDAILKSPHMKSPLSALAKSKMVSHRGRDRSTMRLDAPAGLARGSPKGACCLIVRLYFICAYLLRNACLPAHRRRARRPATRRRACSR